MRMANERSGLVQNKDEGEFKEKFAMVCKKIGKFFLDFVRLATLALSVVAIVLAAR